ncbi:ribosome biogenesis protein Nop16 [Xylaria bambusicola]|uniref:ribosome biogenesis protein Nop16 n=1 Tax=Xylaria bambusicola TaxID=326684 RepID=UPI002007AE2C|nr:ribosome biogenesis protein Nop16 [Xylaria bambusicola]KAI0525312.1 ribosome biogenesis protein Nop16 [Xylaria bambusicola]
MGRELQKRKRRSSRPATRQPSSTRPKLMNPLGNSIIARNWNKKETTTQNYRRLGLVSRLRAPTGGIEPKHRSSTSSTSTSKTTTPTNPFAINGATSAAAEVEVERDADGKIIRVISKERKRANPLNDPLVELDTDSEAGSDDGEDAEEWGGFEGEQNEIVRQLEEEANRPVEKKPRTVSAREAEWLQALVDRHGDDTTAMARDQKLNSMQQTAADIAKRIRKWKGNSK